MNGAHPGLPFVASFAVERRCESRDRRQNCSATWRRRHEQRVSVLVLPPDQGRVCVTSRQGMLRRTTNS